MGILESEWPAIISVCLSVCLDIFLYDENKIKYLNQFVFQFYRSNANGILYSASIIGSACSPWVSIWLRRVHKSAPFFTMGGCTIMASLLLGWLPETKGKRLPQEIDLHTNKVVQGVKRVEEGNFEDSL